MRTRTNLHLDNDALAFASNYANARGLSLGLAVSELIRRAEMAKLEEPSPNLVRNEWGLLVKTKSGRVVTSEMVRELSEDDLD